MTSQSFMIGPVKDGVRQDIKPFAIPEDSFESLTNAYQWRGRVLKRSGYTLLGQLANGTPCMGLRTQEGFGIDVQTLIAFDTTASYKWSGSSFVTLPSVMPVTWSGTDYQFFFTTNYAGAFWATNSKAGLNGYTVTLFANQSSIGGEFVDVTATGNTFQVGDKIYFIHVTGGAAVNNLRQAEVTVAGATFTVNATDGGGAFTNAAAATGMALSTTRTTTGADGIRYYGSLSNGTGWANYNPPIDPNNALAGALMIFSYRGYLVFLNTTEGNDSGLFNYGNRARWTQIGTPYYSLPVPTIPNVQTVDFNAARDDLFGRGGANDAPTNEVIVAAAFIRDILIVYFERSTWRLRFVNNSQNPFVWERVNVELGSDCTFSAIPFDKGLMAIGNRGIVISDGNDAVRFDEKIPDTIFNIRQANFGLQRVCGIRTFRTKLNYWTYPNAANPNGTYPDSVLVYNYDAKTWSMFDDCFTCFGYYYPSGSGQTWADLTDDWASTFVSWDSGISQTGYENIVAGNQQGYVFVLEETNGENAPSLTISAINTVTGLLTVTNHNLPDGSWVTLSGITGTTSSDGVSLNGRNFKIANPTQATDTFSLTEFKPITVGTATGTTFSNTIAYKYIIPGSVQIYVGGTTFTDPLLNGVLVGTGSPTGSGTFNYSTGAFTLTFNSSIGSTTVYAYVVSYDPLQGITSVPLTTAYSGGGQVAKISGIDIQTKYFNFLGNDQKSRLSKIDFYTNLTQNGQFTCNVFADSSNTSVNQPLQDNLLSNIVLTTLNPYQIPQGDQTMYRLFCDSIGQTLQLQLTYSDQQMSVSAINREDLELLALMFTIRKGGRLV